MKGKRYDPSQFMIPESDQNGRSVRIVVQVPPLLNNAIKEIVSSGKFPFVMKDDLIRWSLHNGVKELGALESCTSAIPFLEMGVMLAQINMDLKRFEELFDKLDKVLLGLMASSYLQARARNLVAAIQELILSLPSSRDRSWALSRLRQKWGHLLLSTIVRRDGPNEEANHHDR
jgi:hypothetical protein